jgi:hypothetical protein
MKLVLGLCLLLLASCATSARQEIEVDKADLEKNLDREAMVSQAHHLFLNSPHYTQEQKQALQNVMTETRVKSQALNESIYRAKMVLFQELFSAPSSEKQSYHRDTKIEVLEKQLRTIHREKIDLMISSLHESRKILGQADVETQRKNYEFFIDHFKLTEN